MFMETVVVCCALFIDDCALFSGNGQFIFGCLEAVTVYNKSVVALNRT